MPVRNTTSVWHGWGAREIGCGSEKLSVLRRVSRAPESATCVSRRSGVEE